MKENVKKVLQDWENTSDEYAAVAHSSTKISQIVSSPPSIFHPMEWGLIQAAFPSLKGVKICVLSSGNNWAVFAFALMGANVTSCDISPKQLDNASKIAKKLNLDIEFICSNTMELNEAASDKYDFVYTSNGVHVWIDDLDSMCKNIYRIMKKGALYLMFDIHPFMRPFEDCTNEIKVQKKYDEIDLRDGIRYHWRVQDILNSMINSGLHIARIEETFAESYDFWRKWNDTTEIAQSEIDKLVNYKTNPLAALPQWLIVCAQK